MSSTAPDADRGDQQRDRLVERASARRPARVRSGRSIRRTAGRTGCRTPRAGREGPGTPEPGPARPPPQRQRATPSAAVPCPTSPNIIPNISMYAARPARSGRDRAYGTGPYVSTRGGATPQPTAGHERRRLDSGRVSHRDHGTADLGQLAASAASLLAGIQPASATAPAGDRGGGMLSCASPASRSYRPVRSSASRSGRTAAGAAGRRAACRSRFAAWPPGRQAPRYPSRLAARGEGRSPAAGRARRPRRPPPGQHVAQRVAAGD